MTPIEDPNRLAALLLVWCGLVSLFVAQKAESYHSTAMQNHVERLEAHREADDEAAMIQEFREFQNDRWVDRSIDAMTLGYPVSVACFSVTAIVLMWTPL